MQFLLNCLPQNFGVSGIFLAGSAFAKFAEVAKIKPLDNNDNSNNKEVKNCLLNIIKIPIKN